MELGVSRSCSKSLYVFFFFAGTQKREVQTFVFLRGAEVFYPSRFALTSQVSMCSYCDEHAEVYGTARLNASGRSRKIKPAKRVNKRGGKVQSNMRFLLGSGSAAVKNSTESRFNK